MSDRRAALVARFRAGAADRLRRVRHALGEAEAGRAGPEQLKEVARELHTVKGEARMLGMAALSELLHAVESAVVRPAGAAPDPAACATALGLLDAAATALRVDAAP
ncbi:MAG TPA: Hpt domain-containing protein, partial [Polyangia bacterium]